MKSISGIKIEGDAEAAAATELTEEEKKMTGW